MSDEIDARVEILTALFNTGEADAGAQFYALIKEWERKDVEMTFCRAMRILAATARTPAEVVAQMPTAQTTLEAMGSIMADLTHERITAADAKARLYAHQIALSALRTIETAKARRQKEERLRKSPTSSKPPSTTARSTASRRTAAASHRAATTKAKKRPSATSTPNSKKRSPSTRA